MTVLLGVSMGAHAVRMALPRNGAALASVMSSSRLLEAPQQLFFKNQVIDTVDDDVEYLAAESISAVAAESEPSMSTGVAYRDAHQADTLHRALELQHLQNYHLVHEVSAVVEYLIASGEAAGHGTVALYDLGSSGLNVSVVDLVNRRVLATRRSTEFSGDLFDSILRDNQLQRLGKSSDASDIELFTRRCRVAKERLSANDAVCLPDESGMILLSRDSYETLIGDEVDRSIEFARDVLISAQVAIDAVVLIGGGSRIPLVRGRVGESLDLPAVMPNEPESVAARGAALSARTSEAPTTRPSGAVVPSAAPPVPDVKSLSPRPTDATPTISISRSDLPTMLPPLVGAASIPPPIRPVSMSAPARPVPASNQQKSADTVVAPADRSPAAPVVSPWNKTVPPVESSPTPVPSPSSPSDPNSASEVTAPAAGSESKHFALKNVYWLDADYEDDDGEDEAVRKRRLVRSWSIVGVAAAAVIAVSGFLLTRPSAAPTVVETAVTDAPSPSVAATTPVPPPTTVPVVPVAPPAPVTTTTEASPEPTAAPVQPQNTAPVETATQEAPAPAVTEVAPPPAPEPPPLIPGLPGFTLPTIPPLFPPAP